MLIHSSSQLLTLANGPQRGHALGTLGIIENGAVVLRDEKIVAVGTTAELTLLIPTSLLRRRTAASSCLASWIRTPTSFGR
jgi:hypothetical protein